MTIKLEKILTISAKDYCKMKGKLMKDYTPIGIHVEEDTHRQETIKDFAESIPKNAEIVVGYIPFAGGDSSNISAHGYMRGASGTALIPKKK